MSLLLIIVVLLVLFGGGGGYYAHSRYGGAGLGGVLGLVLIILLLLYLFGGLGARPAVAYVCTRKSSYKPVSGIMLFRRSIVA